MEDKKFARFIENAVCCPRGLVPFVRSVRLLKLWKLWDLARKCSFLFLSLAKPDLAALWFRRGHQFADGVEDHLELCIVLFL